MGITQLRGLIHETLVAVTTNIESRDWERCTNAKAGFPPENPHTSTTDDVECFFSINRDMVDGDLTLKKFLYEWRKCCNEFLNAKIQSYLLLLHLRPTTDSIVSTSTQPPHQRQEEEDLLRGLNFRGARTHGEARLCRYSNFRGFIFAAADLSAKTTKFCTT